MVYPFRAVFEADLVSAAIAFAPGAGLVRDRHGFRAGRGGGDRDHLVHQHAGLAYVEFHVGVLRDGQIILHIGVASAAVVRAQGHFHIGRIIREQPGGNGVVRVGRSEGLAFAAARPHAQFILGRAGRGRPADHVILAGNGRGRRIELRLSLRNVCRRAAKHQRERQGQQ